MRILAAGGGSGGHVTPVLAVLNKLRKHDQNLEVLFVCDRKFGPQADKILAGNNFISTRHIFAGKFRRYHGVSWLSHLLDIPTLLLNARDLLLIAIGLVQSIWHILRFKPDVVFTKGGFVCLPLGLAAALMKKPLVIHDSDAHPGLTNRVLAKHATIIATGAPLENYSYDSTKAYYVGIPVHESFHPLSDTEQLEYKAGLGLPDLKKPLVAITGGGTGAQRLNAAVTAIGEALSAKASVVHITGKGKDQKVAARAPEKVDYIIKAFIEKGMIKTLGAADVVVTRAGATTMAELAALAKAVIIVPNAMLAGGHQVKNADVFESAEAAIVLSEEELVANPLLLLQTITELLEDETKRKTLGKALHQFAKPDAALDMANLIVQAAGSGGAVKSQTRQGGGV